MPVMIWSVGKDYHHRGDHECKTCKGHGFELLPGYPACSACGGASYYSQRKIRVVFDESILRPPICTIGDVHGDVLRQARERSSQAFV